MELQKSQDSPRAASDFVSNENGAKRQRVTAETSVELARGEAKPPGSTMMINTFTDFNMPIAERRVKRQKSEPGKHLQYEVAQVEKKTKLKPKKSQDSGWYKVDGIVGHRIVKEKNKD